jgi:hypothetical protein
MATLVNVTHALKHALSVLSPDEFLAVVTGGGSSGACFDPSAGHTIRIRIRRRIGEAVVQVTFKAPKSGDLARARQIKKVECTPTFVDQLKVNVGVISQTEPAVASRILFTTEEWAWPPVMWCDEWQLGPVPKTPDAPRPPSAFGQFPVLLQWRFDKVVGDRVITINQKRKDGAFRRIMYPVVLFFLRRNIFIHVPSHICKQEWATQMDGGDRNAPPIYVQLDWYPVPDSINATGHHNFHDFSPLSANKIDESHANSGAVNGIVQLPPLAFLFSRLRKLTPDDERRFQRGCYWLTKALSASTLTTKLLNLITVIEGFLSNSSRKCSTCRGDVYGIGQRFRAFLLRYGASSPVRYSSASLTPNAARLIDFRGDSAREYFNFVKYETERKEFLQWAAKLYNLRSQVAHAGYIVAAEDSSFWAFVPQSLKEREDVTRLQVVVAQCLVSWVDTPRFIETTFENKAEYTDWVSRGADRNSYTLPADL